MRRNPISLIRKLGFEAEMLFFYQCDVQKHSKSLSSITAEESGKATDNIGVKRMSMLVNSTICNAEA